MQLACLSSGLCPITRIKKRQNSQQRGNAEWQQHRKPKTKTVAKVAIPLRVCRTHNTLREGAEEVTDVGPTEIHDGLEQEGKGCGLDAGILREKCGADNCEDNERDNSSFDQAEVVTQPACFPPGKR